MMGDTRSNLPEGTDAIVDTNATAEPQGTARPETGRVDRAKQRIREEATNLRGQATDKARGYAQQGKDRATGTVRDVAAAMEDAARTVDERLGENYGQYARRAASTVSGLADRLDQKDVDELLRDAEDLVRKSPAVAIGLAAVAGFALARLVKSGLGDEEDETPT